MRKLGLPEVEIRVNELPADPALKDNPVDDYITWAPTFCRARLTTPMASSVNVVLTNDAPGSMAGGGDVLFATHQDPWPVNTTATANTVALTLPGDGSGRRRALPWIEPASAPHRRRSSSCWVA